MLAIQRHIPLAPFTSFKIGGSADFFVEVKTVNELAEAFQFARDNRLKIIVFSGGSNMLVADSGFQGLAIKLANTTFRIHGEQVLAEAGATLLDVVQAADEAGLAGLENLAGIPGSVGGAIRGNAGAFGAEIGDLLSSVKCFNTTDGTVKEFLKRECDFGYRMSRFKKEMQWVILSAVLNLHVGESATLKQIARDTIAKREAKHPQSAKCAGSFFMNPEVKNPSLLEEFSRDTGNESKDGKLPAGWLIDHVGLRGKKVGGAQVSQHHPNYLVNTGTATAEDVIMLASIIKQRVRDELGVQLREEVQMVGF